MKRPTIPTILFIILLFVIGLYLLGEVDYYSMKKTIEYNNQSFPVITIPAIGLNEKINNQSLSQGIYIKPKTYIPLQGDVILYGHRTLQGSPFLRLNEVEKGDNITINWPGIGKINYNVIKKQIVPENYELISANNSNELFLVTCHPIGSTENRLIIEGKMISKENINENVINSNFQEYNGIIIIITFLIVGIIISYFYPIENRIYVSITIIIILIGISYVYLFPIPPEIIQSKIMLINGEFI